MKILNTLFEHVLNGFGRESRQSVGANMTEVRCPSDPFTTQRHLIDTLNKADISIFDVGANTGQTAKRYRTEFPTADIYCFEPYPDSIAQLQREFADDPKIQVVPKAIASTNGIATLYVNACNATNSLLPRPISGKRYYPKSAEAKGVIKVETVDLDGFLELAGIPRVDILKLDIQGGELAALRGAESLLRRGHTSLIYTEIMFVPHYERAPLFHELWAFLSGFGYSLLDIYDLQRAANGQLRFGDALFISEDVRNNVINKYPEEP